MPKRLSRYNYPVRSGALLDAKSADGSFLVLPYYETEQYLQGSAVASAYASNLTIYVSDNLSGTFVIAGVTAVFSTASTSGTLQAEVATGVQAVGAGTNQLTAAASLSGAANTPVNGVVNPMASLTPITAGSRVNLIFGGTVTNLANCAICVLLKRIA